MFSLPDEGEVSFQFPKDVSLQTFSNTGFQDYGNRVTQHTIAKMRDVFFSREVGLSESTRRGGWRTSYARKGRGEEKELAHFLTRPFKRLSSRLSASGLIRLLLISWKSRIKDQGSVENISNKLPLRDSGFPGKAGSRIKDQGS